MRLPLLLLSLLSAANAAEEILIIGGQYSAWTLQVFDPAASVNGRFINGSSREHVRLNHVGVLLHNSTIIILGGRDMETKQRLRSTALLNINGVQGSAVFSKGPDMIDVRSGAAATTLAGVVWVCGGVMGEGPRCPLDSCETLDYDATKFTKMKSMRQQRGGLALLALGGKLYAVGGESWQGQCFNGDSYTIYNTAEAYDPETKEWSMIASMKQKRFLHTGAVWRDKLFICGGSGGSSARLDNGGVLNSCEMYTPSSNTWEEVEAMVRPRFGFGMAVLHDKLFAVGGSSIPYARRRYHDEDTTLYAVEALGSPEGKWERQTCGLLAKTYAPSVTVIGDAEYRTLKQIADGSATLTASLALSLSAGLLALFL